MFLSGSGTSRSQRRISASGVIPMLRSAATECCVGLVLSSPDGFRYGTSETCRKKTLSRPTSWRICRAASRNGCDSMSPTVPPISVMTMSGRCPFSLGSAIARMRLLISSVICGITCTVSPRYSPRRSLAMTDEYTCPVVTFADPDRSRSKKRS
ncbi:Uncharacterised protein [Mycobacteroides abscessus subsp. abscessus]|nr:Uncharacterised protein [Mycobacteroides abscessus subsp. abscessus]